MNLQAQQKASNKRTGKRISFFNEQGLPIPAKEQQMKEETVYGRRGNVASSQALELPKTQSATTSTSNSNHVPQNSVIFSHEQGEAMRLPQQRVSDKKPNSVVVNQLPERSDANWQHHPSQMWNHGIVYSAGQKGAHPANAPDFYNHEALMRSHEKGVGVSQMDMYGDAVQQMLSQKAQLEQQALAMQHAHINSILHAQKQQQQQQLQKQQHSQVQQQQQQQHPQVQQQQQQQHPQVQQQHQQQQQHPQVQQQHQQQQQQQKQQHQQQKQQQQKEQQLQKQQQQQPQVQQQHQQQTPQKTKNPAPPLQPFQLAFGHQGQKQGIPLPDLFHVLHEAPVPSNTHFSAQPNQALPQMQLFENFYPTQQQQSAAQAYSLQHAASMAQSHGVSQHQMQMMGHYQQAHNERNQGMLKALEQNQQIVLPKSQISFPRRSRRLSKEGILPPLKGEGAPINHPKEEQVSNAFMHHWQQHPGYHIEHRLDMPGHKENYQQGQSELQPGYNQERLGHPQQCPPEPEKPQMPQNGRVAETQAVDENGAKAADAARSGGITGGVIQSTRRRRRISQEANLLTLAQKAVELASLQSDMDGRTVEEERRNVETKMNLNCEDAPTTKKARDDGNHVPLIIPVSVPVKRFDPVDSGHTRDPEGQTQGSQTMLTQNPSVIVTRQRCSRVNNADPSLQDQDAPKEEGESQCRKPKQRPRPEPLFIPPKPGTFIVPPVYSNITPYQSHLRSPVRLTDHPSDRTFMLPPYTPPPILSPVREGSGLYFNAILTASGHCGPPPYTPKSTPRTLLRAVSADVTPPVLTAMGDGTPVSIEPRINVGCRFQAEIPELRDRRLADVDNPMADLVWQPWGDVDSNPSTHDKVEALLTAACSCILPGAGTNQELALHCLHEAKGNILAALTRLLVKRPRRPKHHPLASYHYTGSDRWTATEKKLFNKGIAIYKKDFLLVQKLIKTKTVAQCVEFYYTYKKQVKIGRNGTLIFGDVDQGVCERTAQEESEVDNKCSLRLASAAPPRMVPDRDEAEVCTPKVVIKEEPQQVEIEEEFHDRRKACTPPKHTQTLHNPEPVKEVVIQRTQEPPDGDVEKPLEVLAVKKRKIRTPAEKKKTDTSVSIPQDQEGHFPCKKCGRVFPKVKSRSAHMKSHAEQEKKAAALKERQKEQAAAEEAAAAAEQAARSRKQRRESSDSESSSSGSSSSSNTSSCGSSDEGEI